MNKIITAFVLLFSVNVLGQQCTEEATSTTDVQDVTSKVNTPKYLTKGTIVVKTPNKEYTFDSNEYMVVKRIKTSKHVYVTDKKVLTCKVKADEKLNTIMIGGRKDHTEMTNRVEGNTAILSSKRDLVLDATYYRHNVLEGLGVGVGIDTNGTPKGVVGVDF